MRTMFDAVTAANIPQNAVMVAGYIDRIVLAPWTNADWGRFPSAVKVEIVKKASTNDGHVLDVERGDAEPVEAPSWVKMRRAAGADPTIYCNASTWPAVRAAFAAANVAEPHYWIAKYDGDPTTPPATTSARSSTTGRASTRHPPTPAARPPRARENSWSASPSPRRTPG
jgi:hypothetical protein